MLFKFSGCLSLLSRVQLFPMRSCALAVHLSCATLPAEHLCHKSTYAFQLCPLSDPEYLCPQCTCAVQVCVSCSYAPYMNWLICQTLNLTVL
jgi:hypothetical protein